MLSSPQDHPYRVDQRAICSPTDRRFPTQTSLNANCPSSTTHPQKVAGFCESVYSIESNYSPPARLTSTNPMIRCHIPHSCCSILTDHWAGLTCVCKAKTFRKSTAPPQTKSCRCELSATPGICQFKFPLGTHLRIKVEIRDLL
jgi:hypothetical protein